MSEVKNLIEQTLDSREVAEMVDKEHSKLLKDIRRYIEQFTEAKIGFSEFFGESEYKDITGRTLPCYRITKKGCEFIAHKLTGVKGTIFTARYINRFHEMQDIISKQKDELPWFIRRFRGKYIVLERDFIAITGVNIKKHKLFYRDEYFIGGLDWNGWGWRCNNEEFKREYGFDYGEDDCMMYLYPLGVLKALRILANDKKVHMNPDSYEMLREGVKKVLSIKQRETYKEVPAENIQSNMKLPVQINITIGDEIKRIMIN